MQNEIESPFMAEQRQIARQQLKAVVWVELAIAATIALIWWACRAL